MHDELLCAEDPKSGCGSTSKQSMSQLPSAVEREMSLTLSVRGLSPVVSRSIPTISAGRSSSTTDSSWSRWLSEVAAPSHRQSFGYGNFGNRNNRSWSRDVLVGTHIVADRCCRIVF